jgi:hypothetical protein
MKQEELVRITKRSIPGVTLHPRDGHYQVRQIGLTKKRVRSDPAFHLTRLHAKQLAQTAKLTKLITGALLPGTSIKNIFPRLMPLVHKALAADTEAAIGYRHWAKADWSILEGFEANNECSFREAIKMDTPIQFSQRREQAIVQLPAFVPADTIHPPEGIAHARIFTLYACIDPAANNTTTIRTRSTLIPGKPITIQPKPLITPLSKEANKLHIIAIGVEWYTKNNSGQLLPASIPCCLTIDNAWIT